MKFKAILIDDEDKRIKALKKRWASVFEQAGLDVQLQTLTDFEIDGSYLEDRPHFIIVDNVLETKVDGRPREIENRGIEFIAEHKPSHRDTVFILSTKAPFSIEVLGHKFPNPDLIVPKTALSSAPYRRNLAGMISTAVRRTPFRRLDIPNSEDATAVDPFRIALVSILEQCIHPLTGYDRSSAVNQVNLVSLRGGYSGAFVFRAYIFDADDRRAVPLVFKVSKGDGAYREVAAYNGFVRLNMPHDMRVDLLGCGEAGGYRGALYAFAFGDSDDLCSLASKLKDGDYALLARVIDTFCMSDNVGWYKSPSGDSNAEEFYSDSEEYSYEKDAGRLESLKIFARSFLGPEGVDAGLEFVRIGDYKFTFLRKQVERFESTFVPKCICHGDFNSNNIILGRGSKGAAVIDFEYSGRDIFFKDFVSLECSVRVDDTRHSPSSIESFNRRASSELALLRGAKEEELPYLDAVAEIRNAARKCLAKANKEVKFDMGLYVLALSFHLFKLLAVDGLPDNSRAQLLAAFAACGFFLDNS